MGTVFYSDDGRSRPGSRYIRSNFWRDFDRLPAQALTQDAQQPQFRAFHCDRATVQADEFLDHPSPLQLDTEPLGPVRQNRKSEAYGKTMQDELGCVVKQHSSSRFAIGAQRCLEKGLRKKNRVSTGRFRSGIWSEAL